MTAAAVRTAATVALPAVLLGVLAVDGWRVPVGLVGGLSGTQTPWALLPFAVGWSTGHGRLRRGALTGALVGLLAIASYYVYSALAYDLHAATAQLSKSRGLFWIGGATVGGAVFGMLGSAASRRGAAHRLAAGTAILLTASVPVGECLLILYSAQRGWAGDGPDWTIAALSASAVALAVLAWRRAPHLAFAGALAIATVTGGAGFAALLWAERHMGYFTL